MAVDPKFFEEGETESVFYPKGYVLAAFPDGGTAEAGADALRGSGFAEGDVRVAPGADVIARHQDHQDHRSVGDRVRQFFGGRYGDERGLLDHLLRLAQGGATMVLAYAPVDEASDRAVTVLRPLEPQLLVKYGERAVTDLLR